MPNIFIQGLFKIKRQASDDNLEIISWLMK